TTHDLREAEEECDVVAVVSAGKVVALGPPRALLEEHRLGGVVTARLGNGPLSRETLAAYPGVTRMLVVGDRLHLYASGDRVLTALGPVPQLAGATGVSTRPANLEDVYLLLTGRDYAAEEGS